MNTRFLLLFFVVVFGAEQIGASSSERLDTHLESPLRLKSSFKTVAQIYHDEMIRVILAYKKFEKLMHQQGLNPHEARRGRYGFSNLEDAWLNAYRNLSCNGGPADEQCADALKDRECAQLSHVQEAQGPSLMMRLAGKLQEFKEEVAVAIALEDSKLEEGTHFTSFDSRGYLTDSRGSEGKDGTSPVTQSEPILIVRKPVDNDYFDPMQRPQRKF